MTAAATVLRPDTFTWFSDFLRERSAISLAAGKEYLVESRLAPVAGEWGHSDLDELFDALRKPIPDSRLTARVVDAMTTNETSFFRDPGSFDALRDKVLPDMIARRSDARSLSVWSAASSSGQELYTIAMMLDNDFPAVSGWQLDLRGTDLSTSMVERARAGRFSPFEVNRGLPAPLLVNYFRRDGRDYVIADGLRKRCRFDAMNLATPWPVLPKFDIVFCRNVLIYFDQEVRERILTRIRSVLAPDGYLFLGPGEAGPSLSDRFTQVRIGSTLVYQPLCQSLGNSIGAQP